MNLVATCDLDEEKAKTFARQFGALRHYTDHMKMLCGEKLDAVFVVAGYGGEGDVQPHGLRKLRHALEPTIVKQLLPAVVLG